MLGSVKRPVPDAAGILDASRQPTIEIGADPNAEYEVVAKVLSRVKNANLAKISFD